MAATVYPPQTFYTNTPPFQQPQQTFQPNNQLPSSPANVDFQSAPSNTNANFQSPLPTDPRFFQSPLPSPPANAQLPSMFPHPPSPQNYPPPTSPQYQPAKIVALNDDDDEDERPKKQVKRKKAPARPRANSGGLKKTKAKKMEHDCKKQHRKRRQSWNRISVSDMMLVDEHGNAIGTLQCMLNGNQAQLLNIRQRRNEGDFQHVQNAQIAPPCTGIALNSMKRGRKKSK